MGVARRLSVRTEISPYVQSGEAAFLRCQEFLLLFQDRAHVGNLKSPRTPARGPAAYALIFVALLDRQRF